MATEDTRGELKPLYSNSERDCAMIVSPTLLEVARGIAASNFRMQAPADALPAARLMVLPAAPDPER